MEVKFFCNIIKRRKKIKKSCIVRAIALVFFILKVNSNLGLFFKNEALFLLMGAFGGIVTLKRLSMG
jgi:hypothetical protein